MAINKPDLPTTTLPETWGGTQTAYTEEQIENGYEEAIPQIVDGGNVNYEKKGLFENLKYLRTIADYVRGLPTGKGLITNSNNQLDYGKVAPDGDGVTITENTNGQIQTVAVINKNGSGVVKAWTGNTSQYSASSKDSDTLYFTDDDAEISPSMLELIYPIGSIYITTNATCPLSDIIAGSNWSLISTGIVQAGDIPCKGNGMTLGMTDGTNLSGLYSSSSGATGLMDDYGTYGVNVGTVGTAGRNLIGKSVGVTTDETKSGIIADTSSLTLAVNIFRRTN